MLALLSLIAAAAADGPACAATTTLTVASGTFTDGSEPSADYADGERRCWVIKPDCGEGQRVSLWFTRVDVETGYDFVRVYAPDGTLYSEAAGEGDTFSGEGFTVFFSSDESVAETGFTAHYSCETLPEEEEAEVAIDAWLEETYRSKMTERSDDGASVIRRGGG